MKASTAGNITTKALGILAVAWIGSVSVVASSGHFATLDERIQGSQTVVVASAHSVTPGWRQNAYGDRLIVSRVELDVEETLKGSGTARSVSMDLEGGTLDGFTLKVSDLPELAPGERAVFFLDQQQDGTTTPHLRGQGILKLNQNNVVIGSSLSLDNIRGVARGLR